MFLQVFTMLLDISIFYSARVGIYTDTLVPETIKETFTWLQMWCLQYLCSKQICLNCRMAKRINLPASSWSLVELFLNHPVTKCGLINHVNVMYSSFIMHTPPTISEQSIQTKSLRRRDEAKIKGILKDNHMPYMNSSWPESTSLWTMAWIVGLFSAHHLWKKAWQRRGKVNLQSLIWFNITSKTTHTEKFFSTHEALSDILVNSVRWSLMSVI